MLISQLRLEKLARLTKVESAKSRIKAVFSPHATFCHLAALGTYEAKEVAREVEEG